MSSNALIIFIKNAERGKVKTRLASTLGDDMALKIYQALMSHTRQLAEKTKAERLLFYSQFIPPQDEWSTDLFHKALQVNGNLGDRIQQAFQSAFEHYEKVVIIGSDCATLTTALIEEAFARLDDSPFVIGPAQDGGYYLLGMNRFYPEVFQDIEWSTEQVLPATLEKIAQLGKTAYLLPELSDIDYEEDWVKYGWDLEDS